jgi:uncharacterized protein YkwD
MRHRALIVPLIAAMVLATAPEAAACWSWHAKERKLAQMTNRARVNNGRDRLVFSDALSKSARVHSRRMARQGRLFHTTDFTALVGGTWTTIGENVGVGERIRQIHRAFMRSAAHRANVLSATFSKLGTGVVRKRGRLWVTVLFSGGGSVRSKVGARSC